VVKALKADDASPHEQPIRVALDAAKPEAAEPVRAPSISPTILVQDVDRRFGDRMAVRHVSFTLHPGERVALIGASGSGKTTLLDMLAGGIRATNGFIFVEGVDIQAMSAPALRRHRARCGIFQQSPVLVPQLTIHQNVLVGRLTHWHWTKTLASMFVTMERDHIRGLLDNVGLGERQFDMPGQLSGGQQQRVAIARTLATEPVVLLADEPTASLDPVTAMTITRLVFDIAARLNATLVFCTHWLDLVRTKVDRVIGMRHGKLALDAPPSEVSEQALDHIYAGSTERIG